MTSNILTMYLLCELFNEVSFIIFVAQISQVLGIEQRVFYVKIKLNNHDITKDSQWVSLKLMRNIHVQVTRSQNCDSVHHDSQLEYYPNFSSRANPDVILIR